MEGVYICGGAFDERVWGDEELEKNVLDFGADFQRAEKPALVESYAALEESARGDARLVLDGF